MSAGNRGVSDILWSCLFTIFICCWRIVHPDIPHPNSAWWQRLLDRSAATILGALSPEVLLLTAGRDYLDARTYKKSLRRYRPHSNQDLTIVHGYYIAMGGYRIRYRKKGSSQLSDGWLDMDQFETLVGKGWLQPDHIINKQEILDKGKADLLVKCIFVVQVLWFVIQCAARAFQRLPITTLEISTLAYVPFFLVLGFLWWDKPYNIEVPTLAFEEPSNYRAAILKADIADDELFNFDPQQYQTFGMLWKCLETFDMIKHAPSPLALGSMALYLAWSGIHAMAWNFPFPTPRERWAWRACTVLVGTIFPLIFALNALYWHLYRVFMEHTGRKTRKQRVFRITAWYGRSPELEYSRRSKSMCEHFATVCAWIYIAARTYLLFEVFFGLRSLPAGCYKTVDWTSLIPHFS